MPVHVTADRRKAGLDAMFDAILDGGGIEIRSGTQAGMPEDAGAGTLLAKATFGTPAFDAAAGNPGAQVTKAATAIAGDTNADASGTAAHFRVVTSAGQPVMAGDVAASGSDLNMAVAITAGSQVSVTSFVIRMAA